MRMWETMHDLPWARIATYAPIVTASVAVLGGAIALTSIIVQRNLARRRAAVDFFLKVEMDEKMMQAYERFESATEQLKATSKEQLPKNMYEDIRKFLDIFELFAVGIRNRIFDHRICYHYWSDTVRDGVRDAQQIIIHARNEPGGEKTYGQILLLNKRWTSKPRIWQRWRD
jgi:Domain of unknown function (DUF4760)